jgi:hypothetical protein
LIASLDANTEALGGKPVRTAAAGAAPVIAGSPVLAKPTGKGLAAAPKPTMDEVKAALVAVRDAFGRPAAMKIVKEEGKATEMPGIKPAQFAAVLAKCASVMAEEADEEETEDAEDGF